MDKNVISREYVSTTRCDFQEDGYWKAVNEVMDKALYEGETEWVVEKLSAMSIDTTPKAAIETAMKSVLQFLLENVYNNGFSDLIAYRDYEREFEAKKAEATNDIEAESN